MLIQFSVKNYKTFADEVKLSMVANHDKETLFVENVFQTPTQNLNLLKSAVIYGANASGKTKLVDALGVMRHIVQQSSKFQSTTELPVTPFLRSTGTENESTLFEIIFLHQDVMYRYGFEATPKKIMSEWLYYKPKTKEIELFYRFEQDFGEVHRDFKVNDLIKRDRIGETNLLLSVADANNEIIAKKVFQWFDQVLITPNTPTLSESVYRSEVLNYLRNPIHKEKVLEYFDKADIDMLDLLITDRIYAVHTKYTPELRRVKDGNVYLDFETHESAGTNKFLMALVYVLYVLKNGYIVVFDELDAHLHHNLAKSLLKLFHSSVSNPKNAQIIFNTHNTNLLTNESFRRDQIWFVKKSRYGASKLYSLSDFKTDKVRKEDDFEKNYLDGRYGAIPYLNGFDDLFQNEVDIISQSESQL